MADLKRIQAKVNTVGERKEFGDKGFSKLDFSAQVNLKENGEVVKPAPVWTFEIFAKGESRLDAVVVPGRICEVEYEEKVRSSSDGSQTFTNRSVKQIYIDGKPQAERQQGGGGKGGGGYKSYEESPEKRLSIEAQTAYEHLPAFLKAAKEAGIDTVTLKTLATHGVNWATGKLTATTQQPFPAAKADPKPAPTPKPAPEPKPEPTLKPEVVDTPFTEPDTAAKPWPQGKTENTTEPDDIEWDKLARPVNTAEPFNEVSFAALLKDARWTIATLRSWITSVQKWEVDTKGTLGEFIPRLSAEEYTTTIEHLKGRAELQ